MKFVKQIALKYLSHSCDQGCFGYQLKTTDKALQNKKQLISMFGYFTMLHGEEILFIDVIGLQGSASRLFFE